MEIVLYIYVPKSQVSTIKEQNGLCRAGGGPNQWKFTLCGVEKYALDLEMKVTRDRREDAHTGIKIRFSPLGVAHYTLLCQGRDYSSMLQKFTYHHDVDWQEWHFHGNLPLEAYDEKGNMLVTSSFMEEPNKLDGINVGGASPGISLSTKSCHCRRPK